MISSIKWKKIGEKILFSEGMNNFGLNCITPVLCELHWQPVEKCAKFKTLLLTFKAIHQLAPAYIQDLIEIHTPSHTLRLS